MANCIPWKSGEKKKRAVSRSTVSSSEGARQAIWSCSTLVRSLLVCSIKLTFKLNSGHGLGTNPEVDLGLNKRFLSILEGDIYLGGLPDARKMTAGRFENNFQGCIHNVHVQKSTMLDLFEIAVNSVNVAECGQETLMNSSPSSSQGSPELE